jgi:hypothetical protein
MQPVEFGLDVGGHIDVVDDETLEGAAEGDTGPTAVHDLQAADLAVADLEAAKVAGLDAGTTELVTLDVGVRHRATFPDPSGPRQPSGAERTTVRGGESEPVS